MLKFIGTGSAFRCELGNNSAYVKNKESLLLIDCGGTVFHKLKLKGILDDLQKVHILITHTHLDHIGSLGDLIFYCHYILKIKPIVYYPSGKVLEGFLRIAGVSQEMYELNQNMEVKTCDEGFDEIEIIFNKGSHVPSMDSYNIILKVMDERIYYSGDTNHLDVKIIESLKNNEITKIYEDTCGLDYEDNPHLSFKKLCDLIQDRELRKRVYCMHLDDKVKEKDILKEGFNLT